MNTKTILERAKALIQDPQHWTKQVMARDAAGDEVAWRSRAACCFCAFGALKVAGDDDNAAAYDVLRTNLPKHYTDVGEFNDDPKTTHQDVLELFDRTLATL